MYNVVIHGTDINTGEFSTELATDDEPDVAVIYPGAESADRKCSACGETESDSDFCAYSEDDSHDWQDAEHAWLNSASIQTEDNRVSVSISVGDPRGGFVMSIERAIYTEADGTEVNELRLSLPDPTESPAHMGLVPLNSRGYYRIVASESPEHKAARDAAWNK